MKTKVITCIVFIMCGIFVLESFIETSLAGQETSGTEAKIKIDIDRTIGKIDNKIYGNFVEHLGRCAPKSFIVQKPILNNLNFPALC